MEFFFVILVKWLNLIGVYRFMGWILVCFFKNYCMVSLIEFNNLNLSFVKVIY